MTKLKLLQILEMVTNCFVDGTVNALPNAITSKYLLLKIYWYILFAAFFIISLLFTFLNIKEYFNYTVITQIQEYREYPILFPGIGICNMDPFVTNFSISYLANLIRENIDVFDLKEFKGNIANDLDLVNYCNIMQNDILLRNSFYKLLNEDKSLHANVSYSFEQMIHKCIFMKSVCNRQNIIQIFDSKYGNCFLFNSHKPYENSTQTGPTNSLSLSILVGKNSNYLPFSLEKGVYVFIFNQSFFPFSDSNIYEISPGTSTTIRLSKVFTTREPSPYSDCEPIPSPKNESFFMQLEQLGYNLSLFSYKKNICESNCYQMILYRECGCFDSFLTCPLCNQFGRICKTKNETICLLKYLKSDNYFYCDEMCPKECQSQYFEKSVLQSSLIDLKNYDKTGSITSNLEDEKLNEFEMNLKIYFDDFYYQSITESPAISRPTLVANIGGTVSIFIGISLVTLCEIIDCIIRVIYFLFESKESKENPKNETPEKEDDKNSNFDKSDQNDFLTI